MNACLCIAPSPLWDLAVLLQPHLRCCFFFFSVSVFPLESPIFRGLEGAYEKTQWAKILTTLVLVWEKDAEF